jgi:GAF domain-containing protein
VLEHGDRIRIGNSTMLFLAEDDPSLVSSNWGETLSEELPRGPLLQLRPDDALFLRPDDLAASAGIADQRTVRELAALVRLGMATGACRDVESLPRLLVDCARGSIPVERAAVLLRGDEADVFASVYEWDGSGGSAQPVRVSQTIVDYVVLEGVAVLAKDVSADELFGGDPSLTASGVQSVLAVPFVVREKPVGVLYLESGKEATHFDEQNLHFACAVVGIGAVAIERVRRAGRPGDR